MTSDLYTPALSALPDSAADIVTAALRTLRPADPFINNWLLAEMAARARVDVDAPAYTMAVAWAERHQAGHADDSGVIVAGFRFIGRQADWIASLEFVRAVAEVNLQRLEGQRDQHAE